MARKTCTNVENSNYDRGLSDEKLLAVLSTERSEGLLVHLVKLKLE